MKLNKLNTKSIRSLEGTQKLTTLSEDQLRWSTGANTTQLFCGLGCLDFSCTFYPSCSIDQVPSL